EPIAGDELLAFEVLEELIQREIDGVLRRGDDQVVAVARIGKMGFSSAHTRPPSCFVRAATSRREMRDSYRAPRRPGLRDSVTSTEMPYLPGGVSGYLTTSVSGRQATSLRRSRRDRRPEPAGTDVLPTLVQRLADRLGTVGSPKLGNSRRSLDF